MRKHRRPFILLIISILSFLALASLIFFFPPYTSMMPHYLIQSLPFSLGKFIQVPSLLLFFVLLAFFLFTTGSYILKSKKHGILIAGFVISYLLLRLNHLTNLFFLILLFALFVVLELMVSSRKEK